MSATNYKPDVMVTPRGSIWLFQPVTPAAKNWFASHVQAESYQWMGHHLCVEHRFARDLVEGICRAGLNLG